MAYFQTFDRKISKLRIQRVRLETRHYKKRGPSSMIESLENELEHSRTDKKAAILRHSSLERRIARSISRISEELSVATTKINLGVTKTQFGELMKVTYPDWGSAKSNSLSSRKELSLSVLKAKHREEEELLNDKLQAQREILEIQGKHYLALQKYHAQILQNEENIEKNKLKCETMAKTLNRTESRDSQQMTRPSTQLNIEEKASNVEFGDISFDCGESNFVSFGKPESVDSQQLMVKQLVLDPTDFSSIPVEVHSPGNHFAFGIPVISRAFTEEPRQTQGKGSSLDEASDYDNLEQLSPVKVNATYTEYNILSTAQTQDPTPSFSRKGTKKHSKPPRSIGSKTGKRQFSSGEFSSQSCASSLDLNTLPLLCVNKVLNELTYQQRYTIISQLVKYSVNGFLATGRRVKQLLKTSHSLEKLQRMCGELRKTGVLERLNSTEETVLYVFLLVGYVNEPFIPPDLLMKKSLFSENEMTRRLSCELLKIYEKVKKFLVLAVHSNWITNEESVMLLINSMLNYKTSKNQYNRVKESLSNIIKRSTL